MEVQSITFQVKGVVWQSSNRRPDAYFGRKHVLDELGAAHLPQKITDGKWLGTSLKPSKSALQPLWTDIFLGLLVPNPR